MKVIILIMILLHILSLEHAAVPKATAPPKYSLPRALVSFGPAVQLIRVSPGLAMQGDPGKVELHSLEV